MINLIDFGFILGWGFPWPQPRLIPLWQKFLLYFMYKRKIKVTALFCTILFVKRTVKANFIDNGANQITIKSYL